MDSLGASANTLPSDAPIQAQVAQMRPVIDSLRAAVSAHQRNPARELANQMTYLSSIMTRPYSPATPTEVLLLDYYGRELEIWSAQHDLPRLSRTSLDIRKTWDAVRPSVEKHGGGTAGSTMERYVKNIESANAPAAYAKASKPFLDEVDELEKVFTKQ